MTKRKDKYLIDKFDSPYCLAELDYYQGSEPANNYYGSVSRIDGGSIKYIKYADIYSAINNTCRIQSVKDYCLDRFLRLNILTNNVEFETTRGYYGDEPTCSLDRDVKDKVIEFITCLNDELINDSFFVEKVLTEEYNFILDELKNKKWHYEIINVSDIIPAAGMRHTSKEIIEKYIEEVKWEYKHDDDEREFALKLSCLCQKVGNKYRLIDGYHRYSAAIKIGMKQIITIYCE
jgi:hypothetical protein